MKLSALRLPPACIHRRPGFRAGAPASDAIETAGEGFGGRRQPCGQLRRQSGAGVGCGHRVSSSLSVREGIGAFPDAVSARARRHVEALARCVGAGRRAVLLFCVPHTGIRRVTAADDIDPDYGAALRDAVAAGVEVLAYGCVVTPKEIAIAGALPVDL